MSIFIFLFAKDSPVALSNSGWWAPGCFGWDAYRLTSGFARCATAIAWGGPLSEPAPRPPPMPCFRGCRNTGSGTCRCLWLPPLELLPCSTLRLRIPLSVLVSIGPFSFKRTNVICWFVFMKWQTIFSTNNPGSPPKLWRLLTMPGLLGGEESSLHVLFFSLN